LSKYVSGKRFAQAVRSHWGIENNLHWILDVAFAEDACRVRRGHADENFATLRRIGLHLLKQEKTAKVGIPTKRLMAGWDSKYLLKPLRLNLDAIALAAYHLSVFYGHEERWEGLCALSAPKQEA
jgi:hypothetical protein